VEITQDQMIDLVVIEGKVVVGIHAPDDGQTPLSGILAPQLLVQLDANTVAAGEELILGAVEEAITPVTAEEIEVKLSWRDGRLIFRGEPLEEALAEVERYTTVEFVYLDEGLKSRSISGRYRAGDVDALLVALRLNFNIAYEYVGEGRVLLSSL
jgi:transmembrane sensor